MSRAVPIVIASISAVTFAETVIPTSRGVGADAFVRAGAPNGDVGITPGEEAELLVKNHNGCGSPGSFTRKAYLRFDLSNIDTNVSAATLRLIGTRPIQGTGSLGEPDDVQVFRVWGLRDGAAGDGEPGVDGWDELTLTWNNAPANNGLDLGFTEDAVLLATFTRDGGGDADEVIETSSPELAAFIAGDSNGRITLMIERETSLVGCGSWVHGFASKESIAEAPTLVLGPTFCNPADLATPFGVLDLADTDAFINAFTTNDPAADIADPAGVLDLNDIDAFITSFLAGCP